MGKFLIALTALTLSLAVLSGCDDLTVVRRTPAGTRQETRSVGCSYAGYCYSGGKFGFHYSCSGDRYAVVNIQSFVVRYKSGRIGTDEQDTVVKYLSECK